MSLTALWVNDASAVTGSRRSRKWWRRRSALPGGDCHHLTPPITRHPQGAVLRHSRHFNAGAAAALAADVSELAGAARNAVRDIEPTDDLVGECLVVVVQRWRVAPTDDALAA